MDSMGGLNTSLPGSPPKKHPTNDPPEQLLHAFKAAALSVTQLYKLAATDQGRARTEGYQEALDELLQFLDKENLGIGDGEGWRIRQWATERLDGRDTVLQNLDSDEEGVEKTDQDGSPILTRSQSVNHTVNNTRTASPVRADPVPPIPVVSSGSTPAIPPVPQSAFTFRSQQPYPQDADMTLSDLHLSESRSQMDPTSTLLTNASLTGLAVTRPSRTNARHSHTSNRHNVRTSGIIGRGAGQKRKINIGDFFDIGNIGHGKDGVGGGGKRTRF